MILFKNADRKCTSGQTWAMNLGADIYLDGIVTLVDAKNGLKQIDQKAEEGGTVNASVKQVALADVVLLNKIDMVPSSTGVLTITMSLQFAYSQQNKTENAGVALLLGTKK